MHPSLPSGRPPSSRSNCASASTSVSPEGALRSVRTDNRSYGSGDIDRKNERVEVREGKLTDAHVTDLIRLLADWNSLSSKRYPAVPDDGDLSIRYGDKTVSGGTSSLPKQVNEAHARLAELAHSMPVVNR